MKLYLTHASSYDYQSELYEPLKQALAKNHDIFFPHDPENVDTKSKDIIPTCDYVLAEVSFPSTGQGIELGWADANNVPIICFHREGSRSSRSLRFICDVFIEYNSPQEMAEALVKYFDELKAK